MYSDDPCVISYCDVFYNESGSLSYQCVDKPKCTTDKFCELVSCSALDGTCTFREYQCEDMDNSVIDIYHKYQCDESTRSCRIVPIGGNYFPPSLSSSSRYKENIDEYKRVEIVFIGKVVDEQVLRKALDEYASDSYEFHSITYVNESGNTKVIIQFNDVKEAKNFVEEIVGRERGLVRVRYFGRQDGESRSHFIRRSFELFFIYTFIIFNILALTCFF